MGFSKKDLGDVVWSSETGRDPVFFVITLQGYRLPPTPLNTNTRPPNNGGDAFPNGTSPLYSFRASPSRNGVQANQYQCVKE